MLLNKMRILVFGAGGMLGHKLIQVLSESSEVWGTLRNGFGQIERFGFLAPERCLTDIDVSYELAIRNSLKVVRPDVVINAVGIVKQLESSKDVIKSLTINSIFPHRLASLSEELGFRLICISTDCVFNGEKGNYNEDDVPNATDVYGKSKNFGEVTSGRCLTLRTSIIGRELDTAHSLVEWFLSQDGGIVKGFASAIYSGFPTVTLAGIIKSMIFDFPEMRGLYHLSSDRISKFDLLELLKKHFDVDVKIERDIDFRIDRSLDSSRFRAETGFVPETWNRMIERMAADTSPYGKWNKTNY